MTRSRFRALDEQLRDENHDRVERLRTKEPGVCVAPVAPTHEQVIADFNARRVQYPSWHAYVDGGRFCVRFRYDPDRWIQVHRAATSHDLVRWMRDYLSPVAKDVDVWMDEKGSTA